MELDLITKLAETENYIRKRTSVIPEVAIILGSGLGTLAESSTEDEVFGFNELPHFSSSTVEGHTGRLIIGSLSDKPVVVMQGRIHFYEGYNMQDVTYPVRLLKTLGIKHLIITSACGALNPAYKPYDIILIKDHINLMGENPLRGMHYSQFGARFPDMRDLYSKEFRNKACVAAKKNKVITKEGVYLAVSGPTYETPAETRAYRRLGGDLIGMSVVPEAVAAKQMGIEVAGISYISNTAKTSAKKMITHEDVIKAGAVVSGKIGKILADLIYTI